MLRKIADVPPDMGKGAAFPVAIKIRVYQLIRVFVSRFALLLTKINIQRNLTDCQASVKATASPVAANKNSDKMLPNAIPSRQFASTTQRIKKKPPAPRIEISEDCESALSPATAFQ